MGCGVCSVSFNARQKIFGLKSETKRQNVPFFDSFTPHFFTVVPHEHITCTIYAFRTFHSARSPPGRCCGTNNHSEHPQCLSSPSHKFHGNNSLSVPLSLHNVQYSIPSGGILASPPIHQSITIISLPAKYNSAKCNKESRGVIQQRSRFCRS